MDSKVVIRNLFLVLIIVILGIGFCIYQIIKPPVENEKVGVGERQLNINPMSEYDYLSSKVIFKIRMNAVKQSLFSSPSYIPNAEVFGQIQDNKPWWGVDNMNCYYPDLPKDINKNGLSSESKIMNNPNLLVAVLDWARYPASSMSQNFCSDENLHLMPYKMTYSDNPKTITTYYKADDNFIINPAKNVYIWLNLVGVNARDFGYNWVYASEKNNIIFHDGVHYETTDVVPTEFVDFIHTGGSCGIEGGCNNGSPYVPSHEFRLTGFPASMTLHLWKQKPFLKIIKPDIIFKIVFLK